MVKNKSTKKVISQLTSTIPPTHSIIAKGDSAASNHYWALRDSDVLDDIRTDPNGPVVILPDTSTLQAIKKR